MQDMGNQSPRKRHQQQQRVRVRVSVRVRARPRAVRTLARFNPFASPRPCDDSRAGGGGRGRCAFSLAWGSHHDLHHQVSELVSE